MSSFSGAPRGIETIKARLRSNYAITSSDVLAGRYSDDELKSLLESVLRDISGGMLLFPDSLYDSYAKRYRRAEAKKSLKKLEAMAAARDHQLYKYLISDLPYTPKDNIWSTNTISKAQTADRNFFARLGLSDAPRVSKLERKACESGGFHIHGIVVLPPGDYDKKHFEPLDGGTLDFGSYLAKISEQSLQRDDDKKLKYNLRLALESTVVWYVQTLRNQKAGKKRNPSTFWKVSIPNERRQGDIVSSHFSERVEKQPHADGEGRKTPSQILEEEAMKLTDYEDLDQKSGALRKVRKERGIFSSAGLKPRREVIVLMKPVDRQEPLVQKHVRSQGILQKLTKGSTPGKY